MVTQSDNSCPAAIPQRRTGAICTECGSTALDRLYTSVLDRSTCEYCLLEARKRLIGLASDPYDVFVESLVAALDLREHETGLHSRRVAVHTLILARQFYTDADELREIYWGSLLHDIGKIGVPDSILLNAGRLSEGEWKIMRQHPEDGYRILEKIPFLGLACRIVLSHEERYDGSGYPSQLKGDEIPLPARLFAVIDTVDAMTFDRSYRKALPFDVARDEIVGKSGSQFDPRAVEAFLKVEDVMREMAELESLSPHGDTIRGDLP
ncbi:MAG: HD-GYP domain-containing protein [Betaproteobacteria bacterium]|nr:MAG: HD-GYP domain-containing protein [Betaproteobacteria bacterium]